MKIFITRRMPAHFLSELTLAGHELEFWTEERELSDRELVDACLHADALLFVGHNQLDREFLTNCSHLKGVALNSVGYDHVDVAHATEIGIPIGNTPDVLSKATADTAFLLIQLAARKALHFHKEILRGEWGSFQQPLENLGIEFQGAILGVYGLGRIGFELAKSCQAAFDMDVIYHNRNRNPEAERTLKARHVDFDELLEISDVISVHANLSEETAEVFDAAAFRKMKPNGIFVNTARGGIHDEAALLEALRDRRIWGAGLDVTDPEPMRPDHPLLAMDNCVVLPHIGSATIETRTKMLARSVENIYAAVSGQKMPYCVNPEVYDKD